MAMRFAPVVLLLLTFVSLPSMVSAQSVDGGASASEKTAYREAISAALSEFELGNFAEARERFRVAHKIAPSARTLRGLGITEYELRSYPDSIEHLEQALASRIKPLSGDIRREVEDVLHQARGYVGELTIKLTPEHVSVTLNGQRLEVQPTPILLSVGEYVLEFAATGYATQRRGLTVIGRQSRALKVELSPITTPTQADAAPLQQERRPEETPVYRRWWLWTTIGVVAMAGGVTAALLVRRSRDRDEEYQPTPTANVPEGSAGGLQLPLQGR